MGWPDGYLFLVFGFFGAIVWELQTPEVFECHHVPQPFAEPKSSTQAVFIVRVVAKGLLWARTSGPIAEGYPRRYWALAVVDKTYWGLPWWDHKIVLLTFFVRGGTGFERGESLFVDGNRQTRRLTRHLPIFEIHCTRTAPLGNSEIDMRVMREGTRKDSVRIMGYTLRRTSDREWHEVPGASVGISGPAGETVVTSDQQGLYDISGLPPGRYIVHGVDPKAGPGWAHPICIWEGRDTLKSGDVRECGVTVP